MNVSFAMAARRWPPKKGRTTRGGLPGEKRLGDCGGERERFGLPPLAFGAWNSFDSASFNDFLATGTLDSASFFAPPIVRGFLGLPRPFGRSMAFSSKF